MPRPILPAPTPLHLTLLVLHLLAAALWVGGMAVMHFAVRPAAVSTLPPPQRLPFMTAALGRFFAAVTGAVVVLLASGLALVWLAGGFARVGLGVHAMTTLALVMTAVYAQIRLGAYPRLQRAVSARDWPQAAVPLNAIRVRVVFNLVLGTLVFVCAALARVS
jgi:uncharacterized membrane protein